jgi:integrase
MDNVTRSMSAQALVEEYLLQRKRRTEATEATMHGLKHVLKHWVLFEADHLAPTDESMVEFAYRRRRNGPPSPYTIKNNLNVLRGFYNWAYRYEKLEKDFGIRLKDAIPKINERLKRWVDKDEFYALPFESFKPELKLALGLGWFNGLRAHEIMKLKTFHVAGDRLNVERKRTRRGEEKASYPWRAAGQFIAHRHGDPKFWFEFQSLMDEAKHRKGYLIAAHDYGEPESTRRLQGFYWNPHGWVSQGRNDSSLPFTPHDLRHSFGHNCYQSGVPIEKVSSLMGHSDIKTTTTYYVDLSEGLEEFLLEGISA